MLATDSAGRSLAEFLLDRIDEDEALARRAWDEQSAGSERTTAPRTARARHAARHSPARVLVACEAKRQLVKNSMEIEPEQVAELFTLEPHGPGNLPRDQTVGEMYFVERVLRHLAVSYADHPEYERQWRP